MLKKNKKIYIINSHWIDITNTLAILILNSLIRIYQEIKQDNVYPKVHPKLKKIDFSNSKLDDDFCIYFSEYIKKFEYLEEIDISNNNAITLIGLKYVFVKLKSSPNLNKFYFKSYDRKSILNTGVAAALVEWARYSESNMKYIKVLQKICNSIFRFLIIQPNRFLFNNYFENFSKKFNSRVKFLFK